MRDAMLIVHLIAITVAMVTGFALLFLEPV